MKIQKYIVILIFAIIFAVAILNISGFLTAKNEEANGEKITLPIEEPMEKELTINNVNSISEPVVAKQIIIEIQINKDAVYINGEQNKLDVKPFIVADIGRTIAPVRAVSEELGAEVLWMPDERQVEIIYEDIYIILVIDSDVAIINGDIKKMEKPAKIINNRTVAPIRFIGENLGAKVEWYEDDIIERNRDAPRLVEVTGDPTVKEIIDDPTVKEVKDDSAIKEVQQLALKHSDLTSAEAYNIAELVVKYSKKHNLDPMLVSAMIAVESNFDTNVIGASNDTGLMQIIPSTSRFIASELCEEVGNLKDPETNIRYGTWYLAHNRNAVSGYKVLDSTGRELSETEKTIVAYNRGSNYIAENVNNVDTSYLERVMSVYKR